MPFQRASVTDTDTTKARESLERIRTLARGGATASEIARLLRVKVGAITAVLEEAPPTTPDPGPGPALAGSSGIGEIRPEQVPLAPVLPNAVLSGPYSISTVTDSVFSLLREINVSESLARGICRRFSNFAPDDFGNLDRILTEAGLSRLARGYVVSGLKEQLGVSTPAPPKPEAPVPAREEESATARMRRTLQETLELRQLQKLLAELDRPTESASPELEKLRAENSALKEALRNHELAEALGRQLQPLHDRLRKLEEGAGPAPLTKDDLVVRGIDKSLSVLAQKAAETGELRKGLLDAGAPKVLLRTAEKLLASDAERSEVLLPPTVAQLDELRRRAEALDGMVPESPGPGLLIPGNGKPARVGPEESGT